jgi:3-phenylpropionate/trans-cinnamate dioxygenase ferredoxin subunit
MTADGWVYVGDASEFEEGTSKIVQVGEDEVVVCRVEGSFRAVENRCSHDDGPLGEGEVSGHEVTCPRHGARFDLRTGAALSMPAVTSIETFEVLQEEQAVYVKPAAD